MTEYGYDNPLPTKFKLKGIINGMLGIKALFVYSIKNSKNIKDPSFLLRTVIVRIYAFNPSTK